MNYEVHWTIDIEANSPEEAAQLALEIQRDPNSLATFFEVVDHGALECWNVEAGDCNEHTQH